MNQNKFIIINEIELEYFPKLKLLFRARGNFSFWFFFLVFLFFFLWNQTVQAGEFRRFGQDFRALSMGNTGIASASNSNALFYNPAVLAMIKTWWVDLKKGEVTLSDDAIELIGSGESGDLTFSSAQAMSDFIKNLYGKKPYAKFSTGNNAVMNIAENGLTIGWNNLIERTMDARVKSEGVVILDYLYRFEEVRQAGFSFPLSEYGNFAMGVVLKRVDRQELDVNYSMIQLMNGEPFPNMVEDAETGTGLGLDVGFLVRPFNHDEYNPLQISVGAVLRSPVYFSPEGNEIPEEVAMGLAASYYYQQFRMTGAMDFRDLTKQLGNEQEKSSNRRQHFGFELGFLPIDETYNIISLRIGINQGYQTYGAEASMGHFIIMGLTKYVEETGEYAGQESSSRNVVYLSLGF